MRAKIVVSVLGFVALLLLGPSAGWALGTCRVTSLDVDFGRFDPLRFTGPQAVGYITVACLSSATNLRISLSAGQSQNASKRALAKIGGGDTLPYLLTLDPTYTQVWGDGIGGTGLYQQYAVDGGKPLRIPLYAVLLAPPTVPEVGRYTDAIRVQIFWN